MAGAHCLNFKILVGKFIMQRFARMRGNGEGESGTSNQPKMGG